MKTQKINVTLISGQSTNVKLGLNASTVSLLELASIASIAQKEKKI